MPIKKTKKMDTVKYFGPNMEEREVKVLRYRDRWFRRYHNLEELIIADIEKYGEENDQS